MKNDVKKLLSKIITSIIALICAFIAGYFYKDAPAKIKIVKETETKFEYIKDAKTEKELLDAYKRQLKIFATIEKNNWIKIVAEDGYKRATKKIKVDIPQKKNYIFTNIGYKTIQVNYYRKFGKLLVGGGVGYPGNINVGVGYNF